MNRGQRGFLLHEWLVVMVLAALMLSAGMVWGSWGTEIGDTYVRQAGLDPAPCYFAIGEADLARMTGFVSREIEPLVAALIICWQVRGVRFTPEQVAASPFAQILVDAPDGQALMVLGGIYLAGTEQNG